MATNKKASKGSKGGGKLKKVKKPRPPGEPIIINGGGGKRPKATSNYVEVIFDHNEFGPDPDNPEGHINEGRILDYLRINQARPIPLTANTRLDIRYENSGTYSIKVNERKTGVSFNHGRLPYVGNKTHRGERLKLKDYRIDQNPREPLGATWTLYVFTKPRPRPKRK